MGVAKTWKGGKMRRYLPLIIIIMSCLFAVSCGTTRFSFDRTERNIVELGGTYDKTTEEEITKLYESDGLDEVIKEVYEGTYTAVDVQGYLGDDIYKEYEKRVEELKKEIETLRKEEGLEEVANAVLDETYPEGLIIEAFGGEGKQLTSDFRTVLGEKTALRDELRGILEELGYEGIKDALINEEYDEETIEEYLGKSTLDRAKEIYAKETGTDGFNPTKKDSTSASSAQTMEFVSATAAASSAEKKENSLIVQIVAVAVVVIAFYIIAAVVRSLNRGPVNTAVSVIATLVATIAPAAVFIVLQGWSVYSLGFLLILPVFFILTAEMRD